MFWRILSANLIALTMRPGKRYEGLRWNYIAGVVRRRDGLMCRDCKQRNRGPLIAHHKRWVTKGGSHFTCNLKTVCPTCHAEYHPWLDTTAAFARMAATGTITQWKRY